MNWFVPTFYGDFRLIANKRTTELHVQKATDHEKKLLKAFEQTALHSQWVKPGVDLLAPKTILQASITRVATALAKQLKPDRKLISVLRSDDGKLIEYRTEDVSEASEEPTASAATTIAKPVRGCPPTDFAAAEIKARDVLQVFLSPDQIRDFVRFNKFVAVGVDTGHRYMITSRHARDNIALYQRSFYDLDEKRPYCAHDWSVPAAEEMLALLVCVSTPGNELALRRLEATA